MTQVDNQPSRYDRFFDWVTGPPFLVVSLVLAFGLLALLSLVMPDRSERGEASSPSTQATVASSESFPQVSDEIKQVVVDYVVESSPMVLDADIHQEGRRVDLVMVVSFAINEAHAHEMADSFVRMLKSLGPDTNPGKEVGPGIYDYVIGVYLPDRESLFMGGKSRGSSDIYWRN